MEAHTCWSVNLSQSAIEASAVFSTSKNMHGSLAALHWIIPGVLSCRLDQHHKDQIQLEQEITQKTKESEKVEGQIIETQKDKQTSFLEKDGRDDTFESKVSILHIWVSSETGQENLSLLVCLSVCSAVSFSLSVYRSSCTAPNTHSNCN